MTSSQPLAVMSCRICGQPALHRFVAKGDRSGESIRVYFCNTCNARFTAPPDFDYETQDEGLIAYYEMHRDYILWRHNRIFDYLERSFSLGRGSFLDIGSGAGYSLEVAVERGWAAQGIEPGGTLARCCIPDDYIDSRRYPLFVARAAMAKLIAQLQASGKDTR